MDMIAYEFYSHDEINGNHLIGILPERRRNPKRITKQSIMKWARQLLDDNGDMNGIFFVKVTLGQNDDIRSI
jgi:hypothetical protein